MILLDTCALLWLEHGHPRAKPLLKQPRLFVSPATILELQFLIEADRLRLRKGYSLTQFLTDGRWKVDAPMSDLWLLAATDVGWTRDPFDRLIVAHATMRRWRLATADSLMSERLPERDVLSL